MKTFLQWAKDNNKAVVIENVKRAGISHNYPDAYAGRGYAYPDAYFTPVTSTAIGKLQGKVGS